MYIVVCIYCAIRVILACDVYLPDLRTSTRNLGLWIYSQILASQAGQSQAKIAAWEALRSVPDHVTRREYGAICFWKEAGMDSFAAVPPMSSLLKYVQTINYCPIKE